MILRPKVSDHYHMLQAQEKKDAVQPEKKIDDATKKTSDKLKASKQ